MNSLQTNLAITILINAVVRAVKSDASQPSTYIRLRLNPRDFVQRSPEIGYLDMNSQARYIPRGTMGAEADSIAALAMQLAKGRSWRGENANPATMTFELEAVEIGRRWCVTMKITEVEPHMKRFTESSYQCRVLCGDNSTVVLAA